jgi:hypothetical protein
MKFCIVTKKMYNIKKHFKKDFEDKCRSYMPFTVSILIIGAFNTI